MSTQESTPAPAREVNIAPEHQAIELGRLPTPSNRLQYLLTRDNIRRADLVARLQERNSTTYGKGFLTTFREMLLGRSPMPDQLLQDIQAIAGYSADYIKTGSGKPLERDHLPVRAESSLTFLKRSLPPTDTPQDRLSMLMQEDHITQAALAKQLNRIDADKYSVHYYTTISTYLRGIKPLPSALLDILQEHRGYSKSWIRTGEGRPRVEKQIGAYLPLPYLTIDTQVRTRGRKAMSADLWPDRYRMYGYGLDQYAGMWVVEVADDAMIPGLQPEAKILCRPLDKSEWDFLSGPAVVCFTGLDGLLYVTTRRLDQRKRKADHIKLISDKDRVFSVNIPVQNIHWLAKAERIIDSVIV